MSLVLIFLFNIFSKSICIPLLYLHTWDERFHALVAKNLIQNPLKPVLISENLLQLDFKDWACNYIWLSKPPLALWNIALSINFFGNNEFGLRLPSVIISTISVYLTYKICILLYNKNLAVLAAYFHAFNGLFLDVATGRVSSDHTDTLFVLLTQISFYYLLRYFKEDKAINICYSSFWCGLSFLCKWIMSLFVPIIFFILLSFFTTNIKKILFNISIFTIIFLIMVLPWLIFSYYSYPVEAEYMYRQIFKPVSTVIHQHDGAFYYYLNSIRINFHELIYIPLIFVIYYSIVRKDYSRFLLLIWIFVPMLVLSCMSTKRQIYMLVSSTPFYILLALFLRYLNILKYKLSFNHKFFINIFVILALLLPVRYNLERIKPFENRFLKPQWREQMEVFVNEYKSDMNNIILVNEPKYIEARFYYDIKAYNYLSEIQIEKFKNMNFKIFYNNDGIYTKL